VQDLEFISCGQNLTKIIELGKPESRLARLSGDVIGIIV